MVGIGQSENPKLFRLHLENELILNNHLPFNYEYGKKYDNFPKMHMMQTEKGTETSFQHIFYQKTYIAACVAMFALLSIILVFSMSTFVKMSVIYNNLEKLNGKNVHGNEIENDFFESEEGSDVVQIVSRQQWQARPAKDSIPLELPAEVVVISHTATQKCDTSKVCIKLVKSIQRFHMDDKQWWDIGYNFLIGGDGKIYEGRGWSIEGAHTYGYNKNSIGIAFIGNFGTNLPYPRQLEACKALLSKGIEKGYLSNKYKLFGASQLSATESPGTALMKEISKWDHFSNETGKSDVKK